MIVKEKCIYEYKSDKLDFAALVIDVVLTACHEISGMTLEDLLRTSSGEGTKR